MKETQSPKKVKARGWKAKSTSVSLERDKPNTQKADGTTGELHT